MTIPQLPTPADRPDADIVLYDGACNFCRASAKNLAWWDCQGRLAYLSIHETEVAERWPDLSRERLQREMCVVERQAGHRPGHRHWGPYAIRYLTGRLRRLWWAMPWLRIPGAMWLFTPIYRLIARNRYLIAGKHETCDDGACSLPR